MRHRAWSVRFVVVLAALASARGEVVGQGAPQGRGDREYTLETTMLGYRGVGGDIDGIRNPTLWARTGETVRITIVNGELMVHDIALEKLEVKSAQILDKGVTHEHHVRGEGQATRTTARCPGIAPPAWRGGSTSSDAPRPVPAGVAPTANGRPLNLDFEPARSTDWTADRRRVRARRTPRPAPRSGRPHGPGRHVVRHQPDGRQRAQGHALLGARSASPSRIASFLVAGGAFASTRVELVPSDDKKVVYTISGANRALMRPVVADLAAYVGRDMFVRLVDDETGASTAVYLKESPWAYISFDNFRLHESRPYFANELTASETVTMPPMDSGAACRPLTGGSGTRDDGAEGIQRHARRVGAGRRPADRLHARRSRPPVGRRGAHLPDSRAPEGAGRGPHPDSRGHRRRRPARQAQGVHREPEPRQRPRGRVRRRLGRRRAVPDVHPDHRTATTCRPVRRRSCSTAGATKTRTKR